MRGLYGIKQGGRKAASFGCDGGRHPVPGVGGVRKGHPALCGGIKAYTPIGIRFSACQQTVYIRFVCQHSLVEKIKNVKSTLRRLSTFPKNVDRNVDRNVDAQSLDIPIFSILVYIVYIILYIGGKR